MGAGLPVVVSPVGINAEIIDDGQNGYIATSNTEWFKKLSRLIKDEALRKQLGQAGRKYIEIHNSQAIIAHRLINVLTNVANG